MPLPRQNPCRRYGQDATHAVIGYEPDMSGGGVLFWAYSLEDANRAAEAFREEGYKEVAVKADGDEQRVAVHEIVFSFFS